MARQTLKYLMQRFAEVGIEPKTKYGQNFLIDLNLLDVLVDAAQLGPDDVVLEVGTGTGSLTALMAPLVAEVVTVEVDPQMHQLASEELFDHRNVTQLLRDVLKKKSELDPELMQILRTKLAADTRRKLKLAANLPYHVATPLISNLLMSDLPPVSMTVTIQKELGDRICAVPGTRDYSALSVWVQCQCDVSLVRVLAPSVFWPRPKVDSAIVRIVLDPARRAAIPDLARFHDFTRALFLHRRKLLRGTVVAAYGDRLTKPQVDEAIAELGFAPSLRAEELPYGELLRLCELLHGRMSAA